MPRAFSETERAHIEAQLLAAARELVPRVGLKGATVSALTAAAGISKGAFYQFFDSKEALVLAALQQEELTARAEMRATLAGPGAQPKAQLAAFLRYMLRAPDRFPLIERMTRPEELDRLMRALPPEVMAENSEDDDAFFTSLLGSWWEAGLMHEVPRLAALRLPRLLFALQAQRAIIGEDAYDDLVELLVESLADRLSRRGEP